MKLAVLIVGEYRTFSQCRKTMSFLDQTDPVVNVYFSTWSRTTTVNPLINKVGSKPISDRKVSIEEIKQALNREAVIKIHKPAKHTDSFIKMREGWLLGIDMIKESKIEYDYVYVMRPDLFYRHNPIFKDISPQDYENSLGLLDLPQDQIASDTSFFSTYKNIKKLLTEEILELDQSYGSVHHIWHKYITDKGLTFSKLPFSTEYLIGRYPMNANSDWTRVSSNFWRLFHNRK